MSAKKNNEKPDYLEDLQRLQAEFENYKKRQEKEQENLKNHIKSQLLLKVLNIADDFERAAKADGEELKKGIQMMQKQITKLL